MQKISFLGFLFALTFCLLVAKVNAQDSLGIFQYHNLASFEVGLVRQELRVSILGENADIVYQPDKSYSIGFDGSYKWLSGGFSVGLSNDEGDLLKQKTIYYDFRTNFYFRRFIAETNFQFYKGFNIDKIPAKVQPSALEKMTPNLCLLNVGTKMLYAFNPKYSFNAIYDQTERFTSSRGTLVAGVNLNYDYLEANSSFFPDLLITRIAIPDYKSHGHFFTFSVEVGYQYAFVWRKWFIAPMATIGGGIQYQDYIYKMSQRHRFYKNAFDYTFNLPIGFNGNRFYGGFLWNYQKNKNVIQGGEMELFMSGVRFFVGWRFMYHSLFNLNIIPESPLDLIKKE